MSPANFVVEKEEDGSPSSTITTSNNNGKSSSPSKSLPLHLQMIGSEYEDVDEELRSGNDSETDDDDPVGTIITNMLNEGKVPLFHYKSSQNDNNDPSVVVNNNDNGRFKLTYPLISVRNYQTVCNCICSFWNNTKQQQVNNGNNSNMKRQYYEERRIRLQKLHSSMRFLLESFTIIYIALYTLNDIVLRLTLEYILLTCFTILSTVIVDLHDLQYILQFITSSSIYITLYERVSNILISKVYNDILHRELLWGHNFEGRTFTWSDSNNLVSFRRKHRHLLSTNNNLRTNRKNRRKSKVERRKRDKRGEGFTQSEIALMEKENVTKQKLTNELKELKRIPPTFFPENDIVLNMMEHDVDKDRRNEKTDCHLDSLAYCQRMIFIKQQEEEKQEEEDLVNLNDNSLKPVLVEGVVHSNSSAFSPKESIEVQQVNPQFPDIGSDDHHHKRMSSLGSLSDTSFEFDDRSSDDYSPDDSDGDDYNDKEDEDGGGDGDNVSIGTYGSESTTRSMPWVIVGAQIGHKILNARKLRRVIANPPTDAAQQLIPEEAKKFIDGIVDNDLSFDSGGGQRNGSDDASSADSQSILMEQDTLDDMEQNCGVISSPVSQSKSSDTDNIIPKRPVHGMWTRAGAVATSVQQQRQNSQATTSSSSAMMAADVDPSLVSLDTLSRCSVDSHNGNNIEAPPPPSPDNSTPLPLIKYMPHITPGPSQGGGGTVVNMDQNDDSTPQKANGFKKANRFQKANGLHPPLPLLNNGTTMAVRLAPIAKGVKMVVPMFPPNSQGNSAIISGSSFYQMGTVMSSQRIYVAPNQKYKSRKRRTNCLSIKVILDKALLRGSQFVEMNLRIMDEWNYVPRHSKFAIGSCVATMFGVGILVGWRVEDDMHIIRALWNRSGPGSGLAYLRRDSVHGVVEAAVGFDVQTTYGTGKVVSYVKGGRKNTSGKYFVKLYGRHKGRVVEFNRCQILSCQGATFVPVTEHIRAAALYRLEVLHYKAKLREQMLINPNAQGGGRKKGTWRNFSEYVDLFANSFSQAISEDPDFDSEFDKFVLHIINLLDGEKDSSDEKKDGDGKKDSDETSSAETDDTTQSPPSPQETVAEEAEPEPSSNWWNLNDLMKAAFCIEPKKEDKNVTEENEDVLQQAKAFEEAHQSVEILIRVLLRTLTVARASVPDRPKLHLALASCHEVLLFVRQILRVQGTHTSKQLVEAWFRALHEISETFGPLKQRTAALGVQIGKKFKKHGSIAKRRLLRFVDIVLGDTRLLQALELGDWKLVLSRFEVAIVKAGITDAATCDQLHKGAVMMYKNLAPRKTDRKSKAAAARNTHKMVNFAKVMRIVASPGRSIVRLLTNDDVLVLFDRILVRVFEKDPLCSMVINIYAFNFESIRHLRILNNMSIAGKLWETVLDAIDEELTFATGEIPEQTKYFIEPFVKLFSLGVAQFHCIQSGGSNADWLDFLMEEDAVKIIQELDYKLIDSLEALCNDIKQVVQVLPYIKTIDNDILNLMDEFDFDIFLKEITDVIGDSEKTMAYMTERSAILVERFLDYLPRMSIPIERVPLQDGWVLTCRSKDGGDLRLSDLSVLRENLHLSVLGSDNVFVPLSGQGDKYIGSPRSAASQSFDLVDDEEGDESVIDEVRELILSAQSHGAWVAGVGGLRESSYYNGVPTPLAGLPMSDKLMTQVDLWQTNAISDFDLLETIIREVSHQIQLQKEREENGITAIPPQSSKPKETPKQFNPKLDPTILFLDIKNLTLRLEEFGFRVEKGQPLTIFDPVFEGQGNITVKNVSIALKVEVKKERVFREGLESARPVLQLAEFDIRLEKLKLEFMETGADWILNAVLKGFSHQIAEIVQDNLKEQIGAQVHIILDQANDLLNTNPDILLNALGIKVSDLDESIVSV